MEIHRSARLRLRLECRLALRRLAQNGNRSDALPNLRADALRMHNCAQSIGRGARLPAQGGAPRVLVLARQIVSNGSADQKLSEIERMTAEFDDAHYLTICLKRCESRCAKHFPMQRGMRRIFCVCGIAPRADRSAHTCRATMFSANTR